MNDEDLDAELLAQYRALPGNEPAPAVDRVILAAAKAHRWNLARTSALLVAACATLAAVVLNAPAPEALEDSATYGLREGAATAYLTDLEAIRQSEIRQMPGGAN